MKSLKLTMLASMSALALADGKGMKSTVTGTDMMASNGVVHMIDTVVMK